MFQNTVHGECIYGNLLNGEWVESESGKQLEIRSPVDGSLIGKIQAMTKKEVDEAILDTKMHARAWAETPSMSGRRCFTVQPTCWKNARRRSRRS